MYERKLIKEVKTTKLTPSEMKNFLGDHAMDSVKTMKLVPYEAKSTKTKSKPRSSSFRPTAKKTPDVGSSGKSTGKKKSRGRLGKMKSSRRR
tara:strand:- start:262 stop:537 length:276 start_codon:yes stop_codon:yes gene_type:complete